MSIVKYLWESAREGAAKVFHHEPYRIESHDTKFAKAGHDYLIHDEGQPTARRFHAHGVLKEGVHLDPKPFKNDVDKEYEGRFMSHEDFEKGVKAGQILDNNEEDEKTKKGHNVGFRAMMFALMFLLGLGCGWVLLAFLGWLAGLSLPTSWVRITLYAMAFGVALAVRVQVDPDTSMANRVFWRIGPLLIVAGLLVAAIITQDTIWFVAMLSVSAGWAWLVSVSAWTASPRNPWRNHPLRWRCAQVAVYGGCLAVIALLVATITGVVGLTGPWIHLMNVVLVFGCTALASDRLLRRVGRRSASA